jgi:hypothetical protein
LIISYWALNIDPQQISGDSPTGLKELSHDWILGKASVRHPIDRIRKGRPSLPHSVRRNLSTPTFGSREYTAEPQDASTMVRTPEAD